MRFFTVFLVFLLVGCSSSDVQRRSVYLLIDSSSAVVAELQYSKTLVMFYLSQLEPGDSLAVAQIDHTGERQIYVVAQVTFDGRPSYLNAQKRQFAQAYDVFLANLQSAPVAELTQGFIHAAEYLNGVDAAQKEIVLLSDLQGSLSEGSHAQRHANLKGIRVTALNVLQLREEEVDPESFMERMAEWRDIVETWGGQWRILSDLNQLQALL